MKVVLQPFGERTLGEMLKSALSDEMESYSAFQAAIAFVKRSGVQHIQDELQAFIERGGCVRMALGVDYQGTSLEGLSASCGRMRASTSPGCSRSRRG